MWYEDRSTDKLGVCYGGPQDQMTYQEVSEMFERLVITHLIDNTLTPYLAQEWASKAHHYARLSILAILASTTDSVEERAYDAAYAANEQHQRELQCDTPLLINTLIGSARLAFSVPEPKGK